MRSSRTFDIVLLGATGFTGRLTAQYLAVTTGKLRWALAGRNRDKLEAVRASLRGHSESHGVEPPELLNVDSSDRASVEALAESTRVVISTVGPYLRHGEPLVAACAKAGTDYVDLTGEPSFVEKTTERYHAQAVASGAKIVHACGFDSIPHDLGVLFTIRALEQRVPGGSLADLPVTIEGFVRTRGAISGGTWQSLLLALSETSAFARREPGPPLPGRLVAYLGGGIRMRRDLGFWAVPMPSIDPEVVCRSAQLSPRYGREFRYGHYLGIKRLPQVAGLVGGMSALFVLSKSKAARELLGKLRPAGTGPTPQERARSYFRVIFLGAAGEARVRCEVRGGDPGYGETAKMLAESALCLAIDRERLPDQCGVVTSAAAFGEVLIERLSRAGISFEQEPWPAAGGGGA
jgi:short subunit dehydrogenase-like uncharacterized protein